MRRGALAAVFLLFLFVSPVQAEFYRWIDKDGKENFTNDREQVPHEYRGAMSTIKPEEGRVKVEMKPAAKGKPASSVRDHKDNKGRGEEYWRKRAAKIRKDIAVLQDKYDLLLQQEREEENKPKTLTVGNTSNKTKSTSGLEKKKSAIERDLTRKKHELEVELPEEARKADAYPGWLRE